MTSRAARLLPLLLVIPLGGLWLVHGLSRIFDDRVYLVESDAGVLIDGSSTLTGTTKIVSFYNDPAEVAYFDADRNFFVRVSDGGFVRFDLIPQITDSWTTIYATPGTRVEVLGTNAAYIVSGSGCKEVVR